MLDVLLWIAFTYLLIGLCIFWTMACIVDSKIPNFKQTVQIALLWPIVIFVFLLFKFDEGT